jgi:hypothetical protein
LRAPHTGVKGSKPDLGSLCEFTAHARCSERGSCRARRRLRVPGLGGEGAPAGKARLHERAHGVCRERPSAGRAAGWMEVAATLRGWSASRSRSRRPGMPRRARARPRRIPRSCSSPIPAGRRRRSPSFRRHPGGMGTGTSQALTVSRRTARRPAATRLGYTMARRHGSIRAGPPTERPLGPHAHRQP